MACEGVGECERADGLRDGPGEDAIPSGGDVESSSGCCSALWLFCSGSVWDPCLGRGVAAEAKLGDGCCNSSVPGSPAGASLSTTCVSSVSEGGIAAGAGEASLLLLGVLLSPFIPRGHVGVRARNFTLGPSGLRLRMGRSDDCGLNLVIAFRLVFSRMVSMSCCRGIHQRTMRSLLETDG